MMNNTRLEPSAERCSRLRQARPATAHCLLMIGLLAVAGGCATKPQEATNIDPAARKEIDRMCAAIGHLTSYRLSAESLTDEALPSGQLVQVGRTSELKVARPDRLAVTVTRDDGTHWSLWLSGGSLVLLDETEKRYARVTLPPSLDEALEELADRYDLCLPLSDLVSGLQRADLLARAESGLYVGTETVAGQVCHHVLFRQPVADWQAWVEAGDAALPRRILMTYKDEPGQPGYQATITEWDTAPQFDKETWQPRLPPDASEVEIAELLGKE